MENNGIHCALHELMRISTKKGYLVFDDIYEIADKWALSIRDVDYLSDSIVTQGILVYDEAPITNVLSSDDSFNDFAQIDYDEVFRKIIELDPSLESFISAVRDIVPPQSREMDQLKYQLQEGNQYARERVIQMYLRLAARIALQRAETYDTDIADTLQEACIGLLLAADKYNPDTNGPFGSYASIWILQNLGRTQETKRPTIYYPVQKRLDYVYMYPILKEKGFLNTSEIWFLDDARELIQVKLGCNVDQAEDIIRQSMPLDSIEDVYERFLKDVDSSNSPENKHPVRYEDVFYLTEDADGSIEKLILRQGVEGLLTILKPREQEIIKARYGFNDGREKTLEEVGKKFGLTRERVRQIELNAIKKLSHSKKNQSIK